MIIIIHENAIGCVDYFGSDRSVGAFVVFNNNSIININYNYNYYYYYNYC